MVSLVSMAANTHRGLNAIRLIEVLVYSGADMNAISQKYIYLQGVQTD